MSVGGGGGRGGSALSATLGLVALGIGGYAGRAVTADGSRPRTTELFKRPVSILPAWTQRASAVVVVAGAACHRRPTSSLPPRSQWAAPVALGAWVAEWKRITCSKYHLWLDSSRHSRAERSRRGGMEAREESPHSQGRD